MRIREIFGRGISPLEMVHLVDLSDIVVIAGPNGVGKTRLLNQLIAFIRNLQSNDSFWIVCEATSEEELRVWGKRILDTRDQNDCNRLRATIQQNRRRSEYTSGVLNFDSERSISNVQPYAFSWDSADPFGEMLGWDHGFNSLSSRFSDTTHAIFRKVRSQRDSMAADVERRLKSARDANSNEPINLNWRDFPDPIEPFKSAFSQLLSPKELVDPEPKKQVLYYKDRDGEEREIRTLSSGEREVVNVVFDFVLRNPSDCVVIFDEPETHLHPELSYRLLQTLRTVGKRNQFIFCTHSSEIISASLDNSVIFIGPKVPDRDNQAIAVHENDSTHEALRLMGQAIGVVALGKRIVLIEGEHGSLDKQTYGAILKGKFSNLTLVPSGGKDIIQSFGKVLDRVLNETVWGVNFYLLCDRDAVPFSADRTSFERDSGGRLRVLNRYHLENFFLEEDVIARVFEVLEEEGSWLRNPTEIKARLTEIAREQLSYACALVISAEFRGRAGNLSIMPKAAHGKSAAEIADMLSEKADQEAVRIASSADPITVRLASLKVYSELERSLSSDEWKAAIPGRIILQKFCSSKHANIDFGRFKIAYIKAAERSTPSPFAAIEEIFRDFSHG